MYSFSVEKKNSMLLLVSKGTRNNQFLQWSEEKDNPTSTFLCISEETSKCQLRNPLLARHVFRITGSDRIQVVEEHR